jgi:hypothetical protein
MGNHLLCVKKIPSFVCFIASSIENNHLLTVKYHVSSANPDKVKENPDKVLCFSLLTLVSTDLSPYLYHVLSSFYHLSSVNYTVSSIKKLHLCYNLIFYLNNHLILALLSHLLLEILTNYHFIIAS